MLHVLYVPGKSLNLDHSIIDERTNHAATTQASTPQLCTDYKGTKYSSVQHSWVLEQSAI